MIEHRKREDRIRAFTWLGAISVIAGTVLILFLWVVFLITGNLAYRLLFNVDYIPIINRLQTFAATGYLFHYITCFFSVVILYYILKSLKSERKYWPYIAVYTIGGGALFFLTGLSSQPPATSDLAAWIYWTVGHGIYAVVVAWLVRAFVQPPTTNNDTGSLVA